MLRMKITPKSEDVEQKLAEQVDDYRKKFRNVMIGKSIGIVVRMEGPVVVIEVSNKVIESAAYKEAVLDQIRRTLIADLCLVADVDYSLDVITI